MRSTTPFTLWMITLLLLTVWVATAAGNKGRGGADHIRGGRMWDKWWVMNGVTPPQVNHPLYPAGGQQSGPNTYRCKECHGWDYKGVDGEYASGPHYTGIAGVWGSSMSPSEMFDLIKYDSGPNGHGYVNHGLNDQDILDIVEFLQTSLIDTDLYVDPEGLFIGDEVQGEYNFNEGGGGFLQCVMCHGPEGDWINFGTPEDPEWIGTHADEHPWEVLHKIRFGQPATPMPSWIENGGTAQGAADIGAFAQLVLPSEPCPADIGGDGNVDVSDILEVIAQWGSLGGSADVNEDGIVDVLDLLVVIAAWGACP